MPWGSRPLITTRGKGAGHLRDCLRMLVKAPRRRWRRGSLKDPRHPASCAPAVHGVENRLPQERREPRGSLRDAMQDETGRRHGIRSHFFTDGCTATLLSEGFSAGFDSSDFWA